MEHFKKLKISKYLDDLSEEIIPKFDKDGEKKVFENSKKLVDFFFKHIL